MLRNRKDLVLLIERHGGLIVEQHECGSFQIMHRNAKLKSRDFYSQEIYKEFWLWESVKQFQFGSANPTLKIKADFKVPVSSKAPNYKRLNIGSKKQFTILEGIHLYRYISTSMTDMTRLSFWAKVQDSNKIPERTAK